LFSVRSVIEGFAIRRTAQKITADQCDELQELLEMMADGANHGDMMTVAERDMAFHRRICEWSESVALLHAWTPLSNQIERFVVQTHPEHYPDLVSVATRHQPIIDILRQRDSELAPRVI